MTREIILRHGLSPALHFQCKEFKASQRTAANTVSFAHTEMGNSTPKKRLQVNNSRAVKIYKLLNAQEVKTKALRQWRIEKGDTLEKKLIAQYIQEAVENSLAGKEIKPQRTKIKDITIPAELYTAFNEDSALKPAFDALSPGKKKEYAGYISDAKREATKISRLEKIIPMILAGQGLHDIYKNC